MLELRRWTTTPTTRSAVAREAGPRAEANGHYKLAASLRPGTPHYAARIRDSSRLKAVVQRAVRARRARCGRATPGGEIGAGALRAARGARRRRRRDDAERLAGKVARLRIFENDEGKFDRSLLDVGGAALVVCQFTLIADTAKGNRPSFSGAARPEQAEPLYERFCAALRELGVPVETGVFGARMAVELVNDGPVTIVL